MLEKLTPWSPMTEVTNNIKIDDLEISFKRTVRVPDNKHANSLPPDMGEFPLFKVDDYAKNLPMNIAQKGGLLFPMYQREALWIGFKCIQRYVIRIFVGGVNAVSGEPQASNAATSLRRRTLISQGKSVQDYLVVPGQCWLDGVAVEQGEVRQFVAMPARTGHSIESQMTNEEVTGGIQFEITRLDFEFREIKMGDEVNVVVRCLGGRYISLKASKLDTVAELKTRFEAKEKVPAHLLRFTCGRLQLEDHRTLASYKLPGYIVLQAYLRLRGGGDASAEMHMSAGGRISQSIVALQKRRYSKTVPITFNVQVLNSESFERVTGNMPPECPVPAETYAEWEYPFFTLFEEPSTISGDFNGLRLIADIDQISEPSMPADMPVVDVVTQQVCPRDKVGAVGLLNPQGSDQEVKLEWELVERLQKMQTLFEPVTYSELLKARRGSASRVAPV
ncbi:integral membrane protein [Fusarium langsethiae]|uniref:Integral membrane protein n=1 Tax=Fusarium langsethiae TaxID=179993 RepID=A0A0N0V5P2_FUSLA|nr:integral membrane protein [Fusarium langsethiae]GKU05510.1 unnamed protein product [Fusarium langsethiae]GKU22527.1 unnamed protein product [Fusarium langsethiae]